MQIVSTAGSRTLGKLKVQTPNICLSFSALRHSQSAKLFSCSIGVLIISCCILFSKYVYSCWDVSAIWSQEIFSVHRMILKWVRISRKKYPRKANLLLDHSIILCRYDCKLVWDLSDSTNWFFDQIVDTITGDCFYLTINIVHYHNIRFWWSYYHQRHWIFEELVLWKVCLDRYYFTLEKRKNSQFNLPTTYPLFLINTQYICI